MTASRERAGKIKTSALQDAIFNSANFSSIATDEKGVIQIFNVGAERMLGYEASDVVDKLTPADISDPQELIARARELSQELGAKIAPGFESLVFKATRGIEDIYELSYVRKDGSRFPAIVSVTGLRDADDQIIGYLLIGTDNTVGKQVEVAKELLDRALQEKNVELEHASRMKSEFLAAMSHELRTPLNAIIGFSEALKDGLIGDLSERQNEYIGDIFTSGQHLLSLINDILDLSKVEAGMMALELDNVDLLTLLSNSLAIVKGQAAAQGIQLEIDAGADLDETQLDPRKMKQIVYNLLSNAVKFTPERGRVTLSARRVPRHAVGTLAGDWPQYSLPFAVEDHEDFLEVCVGDSGIGIAPDDMAKLFQPFSQIDSSLARKFEGTGLGLAMVKELVELHGGTVAMTSKEGEGSRFAAWVPLRALAQPTTIVSHDRRSATMHAAEPGARVALVVEDDDQAADLLRLLLEAEGFAVLRATSGEEALVMAPQQPLSLITLDICLPGIDGWEFLVQLHELRALAQVPVVVIAGIVDSNMALTGGAADVLQKPISRAELKASLANLGLHPSDAHTHTILVVDDDPRAVEMLAAFLAPPAYAVIRAYTGEEAIGLAYRLRPDLILLDLMMPGMSGFDVAEALHHSAETARIPILVVTAKQVTAADRAALNAHPEKVVNIVEKAGINRIGFVTEVRRALVSQ